MHHDELDIACWLSVVPIHNLSPIIVPVSTALQSYITIPIMEAALMEAALLSAAITEEGITLVFCWIESYRVRGTGRGR